MRLYLDENVPVILASLLSAHGVDCLTAQEAGNLSLSDEEQLVFTTNERRVLFTFNRRDFLELAKQWHVAGRTHTGIILSKEFAPSELVRRFRHLLIHHKDQDLTNKVLWLAAPAHHASPLLEILSLPQL
jgi:predicted nuclease of predicted toxin-antitoxin system